jgi:hypothetical protein
MNHQEFMDKYDSLMFARLAIPFPDVDLVSFHLWCEANKRATYLSYVHHRQKSGREAMEEEVFHEIGIHGYWRQHHLTDARDNKFYGTFAQEFPELVEFFNSFAINNLDLVIATTWSAEARTANVSDISDVMHFDERGFGIRAYANYENGGLAFRRLKDRTAVPIREQRGTYIAQEEEMQDEVQCALIADPSFSWILNNHCAFHAPKKVGTDFDSKITFVIQGGNPPETYFDWGKLDSIVQDSLDKYPEQAIWY